MPKKNTLDDFINKARTIHGNLYDYSRVEYVNNKTPVEDALPVETYKLIINHKF